MDREFSFTDLEDVAPGDYYYVRVAQLDGAMAFSSPFWVGRKTSEPQESGAGGRRSAEPR